MTRVVSAIAHILEGVVIVILLAWGAYGILTVSNSTSPNSSGGIVDAIMRGIYVSTTYDAGTPGGQTIPPNSEAQFNMIFETNPIYNASKGWPQFYPAFGAYGTGWGPFLPSDPSTVSSPFTLRYAIFTFLFSSTSAFWLTGPAGRMSATYAFAAPVNTWVVQGGSPGNYTLRLDNGPNGNATGQVTMSFSALTFTPSRPFFFEGIATIGVAVAFFIAIGYLSRRSGPATGPKPPQLSKGIPTDALEQFGKILLVLSKVHLRFG